MSHLRPQSQVTNKTKVLQKKGQQNKGSIKDVWLTECQIQHSRCLKEGWQETVLEVTRCGGESWVSEFEKIRDNVYLSQVNPFLTLDKIPDEEETPF